jgi:hypothetical protein
MKWLIQIMVMFGDLMLLLVSGTLVYCTIKSPSLFMIILSTVLIGLAFSVWKETGGIMAWTKKGRSEFSKGYDDIMKDGKDV